MKKTYLLSLLLIIGCFVRAGENNQLQRLDSFEDAAQAAVFFAMLSDSKTEAFHGLPPLNFSLDFDQSQGEICILPTPEIQVDTQEQERQALQVLFDNAMEKAFSQEKEKNNERSSVFVSHSRIKRFEHIIPQTPEQKNNNQCPYCYKIFKKKNNCIRHIRKHEGDFIFKCDHYGCDSAYARKDELKKHKEKCSFR